MCGFRPISLLAPMILALAAVGCGADDPAPPDATDTADASAAADTSSPADVALDDTSPPDDTATADTAAPLDVEGPGDVDNTSTCAVTCPAGAARCAGANAVETCVADAAGCTSWGPAAPCVGLDTCQAGVCGPACTAADDRCLSDATAQRCQAGQLVTEGCPFGCDALTAACRPCAVGAWRCASGGGGAILEACLDGGAWASTGPCIACACAAGSPVTMRCLGQDDTPTACAACGDDGQICVP